MKNILRMFLRSIVNKSKEKPWLPEKIGLKSESKKMDKIIKKVGFCCSNFTCSKIKYYFVASFCKD